jgi:hypothetical protein
MILPCRRRAVVFGDVTRIAYKDTRAALQNVRLTLERRKDNYLNLQYVHTGFGPFLRSLGGRQSSLTNRVNQENSST